MINITRTLLFVLVIGTFLACNYQLKHKTDKQDTMDKQGRVVVSGKDYKVNPNEGNVIQMTPVMDKDIFNGIFDVKIYQKADLQPMSNLVFQIELDDKFYSAWSSKYRFINRRKFDRDTIISFQIDLNKLEYNEIAKTDRKISAKEFMRKYNEAKSLRIWSTMSDMTLLVNPLLSSSLRQTRPIEINFEVPSKKKK